MGDGGACHPRDNIAMSWLAREVGLSYDWFGGLMECRERQTDWLADLAAETSREVSAPIRRYLRPHVQAGSNLTTGTRPSCWRACWPNAASTSPPRSCWMTGRVPSSARPSTWWQPSILNSARPTGDFPAGSVILDPWRSFPAHDGVEIVPVGVAGCCLSYCGTASYCSR